MKSIDNYWNSDVQKLFQHVQSTSKGLSDSEASERLKALNQQNKRSSPWKKDFQLFISQYKNPLVFLLLIAVALAVFLRQYPDSILIICILLISGIVGFVQERSAGRALEKLRAMVGTKSVVYRSEIEMEVPADHVVSGDVVLLNAGDVIPADGYILESNDLHVNESMLTGESFPVEKYVCKLPIPCSISQAKNAVFKGTSVINGTAVVLVVNAGDQTEMGKIASSLESISPNTGFQKGTHFFGMMLMRTTLITCVIILIINLLLDKPIVDSILFALALAVGLTPELLPAITAITLSSGARRLAREKVIVKRLTAIQSLGEMNILCSDKTGTLTEGNVKVERAIDLYGRDSEKALFYAYLNSFFESGFTNPIDEAIRVMPGMSATGYSKVNEIPYDFNRKRLSIVVRNNDKKFMITKGAVESILDICSFYEQALPDAMRLPEWKDKIGFQFESLGNSGIRTIAVCYKEVRELGKTTRDEEKDMIFLGLIALADPVKTGVNESIQLFRNAGIGLKIISGDHRLIVKHVANALGLEGARVITGAQMKEMTDGSLFREVTGCNVYAEILPDQKERIIKALQQSGNVVGFLGDGINDSNALKAADVGISIDNAVDIAKETADIVLLSHDLNVILDGVWQGRRTYRNTMKYIYVTTSANFGNMISMAGASLFLPFLPLLPFQILLNNLLSDIPAMTIASDSVDEELIQKPVKWNFRQIKRFMIVFGLQSSVFDFAFFFVLIVFFRANSEEFRTAWFIESLVTEIMILLVIRTSRPFLSSRPSRSLVVVSTATFLLCIALPYLPFAYLFSFRPLPLSLMLAILIIFLLYIASAEFTKRLLLKYVQAD